MSPEFPDMKCNIVMKCTLTFPSWSKNLPVVRVSMSVSVTGDLAVFCTRNPPRNTNSERTSTSLYGLEEVRDTALLC